MLVELHSSPKACLERTYLPEGDDTSDKAAATLQRKKDELILELQISFFAELVSLETPYRGESDGW